MSANIPIQRESSIPRRNRGGMLCIVALLFASDSASADEMWSWHVFDAKVAKTKRFDVTLHSRFRARWDLGDMQQGRVGVVTRINASTKSSAIVGYYYGKEEDAADDWRNFHRVFGGVEVPVYRGKELSVATRGLVERFFVSDRSGFTRYRHRIRLATQKRIGPYVAGEWFFDGDGWLSGRYAAGIRWRCNRWSSVEVGYLYDQRRPSVGEPRHVIVTQFTLEGLHHR